MDVRKGFAILKALTVGAAALGATSALAGGETYWREIRSTTAFPCDGRLAEYVAESGGGTYFSFHLFLACLTDESHASHVLIAGADCSGSRKCARTPPRDAPPDLIATKDFWKKTTIDFAPTKFAVGSDCHLEKQKLSDDDPTMLAVDSSVWVCREFRLSSGRNSNADGWKATPITDSGSGKLIPNGDPLTSSNVALPERAYNLDWLSEVYFE